MSKTRIATITTTTSYQNLATLMNALAGFTLSRKFADCILQVPSTETYGVRVSVVRDGHGAGSDGSSVLISPGDLRAFSELQANNVWIKSITGASTLEFDGNEIP